RNFDVEQQAQLVGLDFAIDNRTQAAAKKFQGVFVTREARISFENLAVLRLHHVFFQSDHAVAPAQEEKFIKQLEQFIVSIPAVSRALEAGKQAGDEVFQNLPRRHDHQRAQGTAGDDDQFIGVQQRKHVSPAHHETTEDARDDHNETRENDHEILA